MTGVLVLGAGYLGAVVARQALSAGQDVALADDWSATDRRQVGGLEAEGAAVHTVDIRSRSGLDALLARTRPDRVMLLASQVSRPIADREPDRTEEVNILGVRRVAEAVAAAGGPPLIFSSSLKVYGPALAGQIRTDQPYGPQSDLAHLSKVYGELSLRLHAERHGFDLSLLRLGIMYGPSPVEHADPDSQTVVDKFRRLAADGQPLPIDNGGRSTIGVLHVEDAARILLADQPKGVQAHHVVAETITVADVAALAESRPTRSDAGWTFATPYSYQHKVEDYLRRRPEPGPPAQPAAGDPGRISEPPDYPRPSLPRRPGGPTGLQPSTCSFCGLPGGGPATSRPLVGGPTPATAICVDCARLAIDILAGDLGS